MIGRWCWIRNRLFLARGFFTPEALQRLAGVERSDTPGNDGQPLPATPAGVAANCGNRVAATPTGVENITGMKTGGVAALNHRLIVATPPA